MTTQHSPHDGHSHHSKEKHEPIPVAIINNQPDSWFIRVLRELQHKGKITIEATEVSDRILRDKTDSSKIDDVVRESKVVIVGPHNSEDSKNTPIAFADKFRAKRIGSGRKSPGVIITGTSENSQKLELDSETKGYEFIVTSQESDNHNKDKAALKKDMETWEKLIKAAYKNRTHLPQL